MGDSAHGGDNSGRHLSTIAPHWLLDAPSTLRRLALADTYALMGDQDRAREEYDKADRERPNQANRFDYRMQKGDHLGSEKNYVEADRQLWEDLRRGTCAVLRVAGAQALRRMAQYG